MTVIAKAKRRGQGGTIHRLDGCAWLGGITRFFVLKKLCEFYPVYHLKRNKELEKKEILHESQQS